MIFICVKFPIKPEYADDWPEISAEFTEATRAEPGNKWFVWSRSVEDRNEYVLVEAFDDPKIAGVACYLARPKTGGVKGGLGLAEDPSHASLSCHQIGPITLPAKLKAGEEVFDVSTSLVFKEQKVVRFYDEKRNALVYLTYSTKLVDGSYKSAVSAVPIMPWG